jgi:antitoxin component YwqK of YwqJK toxin-antitoxin module
MFRIFVLIISILFLSCNAKINQTKQGKEHGKWIIKSDNDLWKGRYRDGAEIGTWKSFTNGRLYKKERFRKNASYIVFYYSNGKIKSCGKANMISNEQEIHWFYNGKWNYYNENGELIETKVYDKGVLME